MRISLPLEKFEKKEYIARQVYHYSLSEYESDGLKISLHLWKGVELTDDVQLVLSDGVYSLYHAGTPLKALHEALTIKPIKA